MGKDDRKAYELIQKNRKIHKTLIKKYHGTWLKEMSDGILASFSAATSEVFCAIEIQQFSKKRTSHFEWVSMKVRFCLRVMM
jgi:hypothetical protein